jgi:hypothetical protein
MKVIIGVTSGALKISLLGEHICRLLGLMMSHQSSCGCGSHVLEESRSSSSGYCSKIDSTQETYSEERIWSFQVTTVFYVQLMLRRHSNISSLSVPLVNGSGSLGMCIGIPVSHLRT